MVDNDSPDGSAARLREVFAGDPRVRVVESGGNVGFAAANNIGAEAATGAVLFFLNPDTIVHDDAIALLVAYLHSHPEAGAVGPRVLNEDGSDQPSVSYTETPLRVLQHFFLPWLSGSRGRASTGLPRAVDIIKGCALAIRREAFACVDGWDERYFMYAEENELCVSLRKSGYQNVFLPSAVITHFGGAAAEAHYVEHQVAAVRSAAEFRRRHSSPSLIQFERMAGLIAFGIRAVVFPMAALIRRSRRDVYRRRAKAAAALWRWYAFDHA